MTIDLLRRVQAWAEGELSPQATDQMLPEFFSTPIWCPGARQPAATAASHAVQRLHLLPGEPGELPTLAVWLTDPATHTPPVTAPVLHQTAGALLSFAMNQRFNAVLDHGGERCLLTCDDLLSLRALTLLQRMAEGQAIEPTPMPDLSRLVPALLDHCAAEPSVRRAWLAAIQSAASNQATVMLDAARMDWHQATLARTLEPLLPPGVSLTVLDVRGDANTDLRKAIAAGRPVHDRSTKLGWIHRVKQRFVTPEVPVIRVDLRG